MNPDDDPPVQFRMSHAVQIAETATQVRMLMWLMTGGLAIGLAAFGYLVMHL